MRLAPVIPPGAEKYLPYTSASFCFMDKAAEDHQYASFYASRPGVIMDWPIYENTPIDITPEKFFTMCALVHPEFAIVPDVRHNAAETLVRAMEYAEAFPGWDRMTGVLQGRSLEEYTKCAVGFSEMNFKRMSVPKDFLKNTGLESRVQFIKGLREHGIVSKEVKWHLLGSSPWPYFDEFAYTSDMPWIVSMDTAEPWNAAYGNYELWTQEPPPRSKLFRHLTVLAPPMAVTFRNNVKWLQERIHDNGR